LDQTDGRPIHKQTNDKIYTPSSTDRESQIPASVNNNITYKKRIAKFMRQTKFKRQSVFLNKRCPDSDLCLVFGNERNKIKEFFGNFNQLEFIKPPIQRIGPPSSNGFVHKIHYKREKYNAYAILKSCMSPSSDNLAYEYFVGQQINSFKSRFPNFVETYALYSYPSDASWEHVKNTNKINTNVLFGKDGLNLITNGNVYDEPILKKSCVESKYLSVLIENIKNASSLSDVLVEPVFWNYHLIAVLFQIYALLHTLKNVFTHYDLHTGNVLLSEFDANSYIEIVYHISDSKKVAFNSMYIAKIIDYGRCFIPESKNIYTKICKIKECDPNCGYDVGYSFLSNDGTLQDSYYIRSQKNNHSHDLRLLNIYKNIIKHIPELKKFADIKRIIHKVTYKQKYGTPHSNTNGYPKKVKTVTDAFLEFLAIIETPEFQQKNTLFYQGKTKLGSMHIYLYDEIQMRFADATI